MRSTDPWSLRTQLRCMLMRSTFLVNWPSQKISPTFYCMGHLEVARGLSQSAFYKLSTTPTLSIRSSQSSRNLRREQVDQPQLSALFFRQTITSKSHHQRLITTIKSLCRSSSRKSLEVNSSIRELRKVLRSLLFMRSTI